jgi:23S rRNA maturation mini-RNase III
MQVGGGRCFIPFSLEERLSMRKRILMCSGKTQENIYMNKWEEGIGKKVQSMIIRRLDNKLEEQNKEQICKNQYSIW